MSRALKGRGLPELGDERDTSNRAGPLPAPAGLPARAVPAGPGGDPAADAGALAGARAPAAARARLGAGALRARAGRGRLDPGRADAQGRAAARPARPAAGGADGRPARPVLAAAAAGLVRGRPQGPRPALVADPARRPARRRPVRLRPR